MQPFKPQTSGKTADREHGHEVRDVNPAGVYAFLIFLTISGAILFVLMGAVYKFANRYAEEQDRKLEEQSPWVRQQADVERQELKKMTEAYRAAGTRPTANDVTQRESQIKIGRIQEPRLQHDEVSDMEMLRQAEDLRLHNYVLLDKNAGRVTIPIEQAMQKLAQEQPAGTAGASLSQAGDEGTEMNVATPAAQISGSGVTRPSVESSRTVHMGAKTERNPR